MMRKFLFAFFSLSLLVPPLLQGQVREVDLKEMIATSGMIFSGVVTEVKGGLDEHGDIVTWTTFRVDSPIRGVRPGAVTIKQYGGVTDKGTMLLAHMRYFVEGERVLTMLYTPSERGFTSPIGMGQGVWRVSEEGRIQGVSAKQISSLKELASEHDAIPDAKGTMPLANMIALIQAVTGGEQ